MSKPRFQRTISSIDELVAVIGVPSELVVKKQLAELDGHMRSFIAESPFVLLGTVGASGACDVSPRGDVPGSLAKIIDAHTFIIPDRRGNRRADSLRNIVETGRVGLLFMIPGRGETLRVNGNASLIRDEEILAPMSMEGKQPAIGIAVEVKECFLQCAKAVIRSKLWEGRIGGPTSHQPCFAEILLDQTKLDGVTVEALNFETRIQAVHVRTSIHF